MPDTPHVEQVLLHRCSECARLWPTADGAVQHIADQHARPVPTASEEVRAVADRVYDYLVEHQVDGVVADQAARLVSEIAEKLEAPRG